LKVAAATPAATEAEQLELQGEDAAFIDQLELKDGKFEDDTDLDDDDEDHEFDDGDEGYF